MLKKRLNILFDGDEVPPIPRATRSPRRRLPCRKRADNDQMCAFDLLATVAGKLLEGESTPSTTELLTGEDKSVLGKEFFLKEKVAEENPEKVNLSHKEDCGRIFFASNINPQAPEEIHGIKEVSHVQNDAHSAFASSVTTSDGPEMLGSAVKSVNDENKIEYGNLSKVDVDHYHSATSLSSLDVKSKNCMKIEPLMILKDPNSAGDDTCIEDLIVQDVKPSVRGETDNIVKHSVLHRSSQKALFRDQASCGFFPARRDNVNLVVRDDDENSSWCTPPRKLNKAFWPPPRNGDRRIKRLLASRYWKATLKSSNRDCYNTGVDAKYAYHNRVKDYKRQRSLRNYPIKKRKLSDHTFTRNAYERVNKNDASFSPGKGYGGNASGSAATMHEATGTTSFAANPQKCVQKKDSHVKLKIKSFKVPELFFEISETATVGSLKRTVMEAVTAILGGGLCVGVLVKGKKIRDDNKTLVQTGIYDNNRTDALGFTLEPLSSQVPSAQCPEDRSFRTPEELTRCPHPSIILKRGDPDVSPEVPATKFLNCLESDHDSAPSPPDMSKDKCQTDSRALIAGPQINVEALSSVPMRSPKKLDPCQRRIRRPFSVSEVEALVHAVERLGTGRWRDVKVRAFDNAKHRTYVDLKDKWKTLVHTARISPQQRRGEPVPQELLDRVLAAHAFWSQHQTKQHSETFLLF